MTTVRIKSKGQFHNMTGKLVRILNQHQVVVEFPNVKGLHSFRHDHVQVVSSVNQSDAINDCIKRIEAKAAELDGIKSNEALCALKAYNECLTILKSKLS